MFTTKIISSIKTIAVIAASSTLLWGCVTEKGSAAGHAEFDLQAGFHAEKDQISDGHFVAENQEEIALKKLTLHFSEIALVSKSNSGGNGTAFDPSNPPEPYENCHANHCHIKGSSDTKSFAEIEAELSGGTVTEKSLLSVNPDKTIELTSLSQGVTLEGIAEGDLPYGEINEVRVVFDKISIEAVNVTTGATISLKNEHAHEDHVHTEPLELSHGVDIDIVVGKDNDQDIHLVFEVHADILGEISGEDIDFADLMAEYSELEIEGHNHEHEH